MFREIILPIFRSTRLCVTVCGIMHPRCCRPAKSWMHSTTSSNKQSSAPEDGQNNCPKHVELSGIISKPLLLHLVGCLYYWYQWCTVKQISNNEIYLLIKYIKSVLWRVAKRLSYKEDARCLNVKSPLDVTSLSTGTFMRNVLLTENKFPPPISLNATELQFRKTHAFISSSERPRNVTMT